MQYSPLGRTGITVSRVCLGTMTFGRQNSEAEAFEQMDYAVDQGIDFFDTAEMYPFPAGEATFGDTEVIVGNWLKARGARDRVKIATKISGLGDFPYVRGGDLRFTRANIQAAVDASLKRMQIDTIDLYQLHWPERRTNFFGRLGYRHDPQDTFTPLAEVLEGLEAAIRAGKVRAIGVSNETPWGVMAFLSLAESRGLPRMASIQNPYSLLTRTFEAGLAEVAMREDCGLLAYSPLAFGALTGKYLGGALPPNSRHALFPQFMRYFKPKGIHATAAYVGIAQKHGLDPAQMAIAFVNAQHFLTSNIIGATSMDQLKTNIAAADLQLSEDVVKDIETAHDDSPYPCP